MCFLFVTRKIVSLYSGKRSTFIFVHFNNMIYMYVHMYVYTYIIYLSSSHTFARNGIVHLFYRKGVHKILLSSQLKSSQRL